MHVEIHYKRDENVEIVLKNILGENFATQKAYTKSEWYYFYTKFNWEYIFRTQVLAEVPFQDCTMTVENLSDASDN